MREIQLRPRIAEHDLQTKIRAVRRLLLKDKVRVQVFFKGRENAHTEIGLSLLTKVIEATKDIADVEYASGSKFFAILIKKD